MYYLLHGSGCLFSRYSPCINYENKMVWECWHQMPYHAQEKHQGNFEAGSSCNLKFLNILFPPWFSHRLVLKTACSHILEFFRLLALCNTVDGGPLGPPFLWSIKNHVPLPFPSGSARSSKAAFSQYPSPTYIRSYVMQTLFFSASLFFWPPGTVSLYWERSCV